MFGVVSDTGEASLTLFFASPRVFSGRLMSSRTPNTNSLPVDLLKPEPAR